MNTRLFKSRMVVYGDTQLSLANAMGISATRLNAKINETDGAEFVQNEIAFIKDRYGLSSDEVVEIFFVNKLS